ncbi:hypothetical protein [Paracoccus sp. SSK6]|uniref:hypothetical protein n=1 Tax=Paracoccus sp. SSK6 TaxID=3143131 RepID=UPI00321A3355
MNLGPDRPDLTVEKIGIDAALDQVHLQPVQLALRCGQGPFRLRPRLRCVASLGLHGFQP